MDSLVVGLLIVVIVLMVVLIGLLGVNIYLTYQTLVKPEAPCYAGAMQPRYGLATIDADHPQYASIMSKLKGKGAVTTDDTKKPAVGDGNYL